MNTKFIPPELQDTVVGLDGQRPTAVFWKASAMAAMP